MKKLYERLIEARKSTRYTQRNFAEMLGCAESTLVNYEKGRRLPDSEALQKIVEITGVNPSWLLMGYGDMIGETDNHASEELMDLIKVVKRMTRSKDKDAKMILGEITSWAVQNPEQDETDGKKRAG